MHRVSSRQDAMLKELHGMTQRIEQLSQAGRDLIRNVHPLVGEIKERVETVKEAVSTEKS
jgi:predicted transcriptional regulator